jgi:hypothetical protein
MSKRERLDAMSGPMSKSENAENARVLRDDELDAVSGGLRMQSRAIANAIMSTRPNSVCGPARSRGRATVPALHRVTSRRAPSGVADAPQLRLSGIFHIRIRDRPIMSCAVSFPAASLSSHSSNQ